MQTTRTHNFSLFVTVLSACLGLLAAGTPAQVYAQQAMRAAESTAPTSGERKCGEAISPDIRELLKRNAFFDPIKEFIEDLRRLISIDKHGLPDRQDIVASVELPEGGNVESQTLTSTDTRLNAAAGQTADNLAHEFGYDNFNFNQYDDKWKAKVAQFDVIFRLDASGLSISTAQELKSFEQAQKLVAAYNSYFFFGACQPEDEFGKIFYTNTKALVENNKILIVTRLPRAGLDKLLAEQPEAN